MDVRRDVEAGRPGRRGRPRAGWDSLTPTEREIVEQVTAGRSNAEIGAALHVSPGTVRSHLRSVFAKLAVRSRTDLAARAAAAVPPAPDATDPAV